MINRKSYFKIYLRALFPPGKKSGKYPGILFIRSNWNFARRESQKKIGLSDE